MNKVLGAREIILKWNRWETGCKGADWMHLPQSRDQEQACVNKVMNRISRFHGGINITDSYDLRVCCDFRGICCSIIRVLQMVKTEGAGSSEVSVPIYKTRRRQRVLSKCRYLSARLDGGSGFFRSVGTYLPD